jgi:hypothetical protein
LHSNPEKRYANVYRLQDDLKNFRYFETGQLVKKIFGKLFRYCVPLILLLSGITMVYQEFIKRAVPLVMRFDESWQLNRDFAITLPVATGLCLIFAGFYFFLLNLGRKNYDVRITKSILLTEKKSAGLLSILIALIILLIITPEGEVFAESGQIVDAAVTAAGPNNLSVFIRDGNGYKLLIKHGVSYHPHKDIIMEIPLGSLPKGKEVSLRVVASDDEWQYESREFLIWVGEDLQSE